MMPRWFLYLQGFGMLIMGVALLALRPRQRGDGFYKRYVNLGTMWAIICCVVGAGLLSMALGYWTWPPPSPEPSQSSHGPHKVRRR